jgi:hypothetical protein
MLLYLLQVLALDKRYLDPCRSVNPIQAEKEEGVIPLTDSLLLMYMWGLSHIGKIGSQGSSLPPI